MKTRKSKTGKKLAQVLKSKMTVQQSHVSLARKLENMAWVAAEAKNPEAASHLRDMAMEHRAAFVITGEDIFTRTVG